MRSPVWPVPGQPAIFDAGESLAIEVDGTFGAGAIAQDPRVKDGDREEDREGEEQPPRREGITMEREPCSDQCCDDDEKAEISEAEVRVFKVRNLHLAGLLALSVLLGRGETGGLHRGIIAYRLWLGAALTDATGSVRGIE